MKPTINYNSKKNGVEISFSSKPNATILEKLHALGFRYHGRKKFWYAIVSEEVKNFVNNELRQYEIEFIPDDVIDTNDHSGITYEPTLENIDNGNYSYVTIAVYNTDGNVDFHDYLVFEPSKTVASNLAQRFAQEHYGERLKEVVVFPRNYKRKARRLFQHGYVISTQSVDSNANGMSQHTLDVVDTPAIGDDESKREEEQSFGSIDAGNFNSPDQDTDSETFPSPIEVVDTRETNADPASEPEQVQESKATSSGNDYLDRVVAIMHQYYAQGQRPTKKQIEQIAIQVGVPTMGRMWEAAELSWLLWYKNLYNERSSFEVRLSKMIQFWNTVQPTYAYSDSSKEIFKQYSTPCPIGAIIAEYTRMNKAQSIFEPSAGNGLLVLGADALKTHVNEIDTTRLSSLVFQGFHKITNYNAAEPFPNEMTRAYDVVVTNPPFTQWEEDKFDRQSIVQKFFNNHVGLSQHLRLEHVMAGLALHCLKDNGRAAIIIMGHVYFGEDGFIAKYRPFFNWLYRHYWVDDVINLNSFKLYNKQGAIQKVMLILISGRKNNSHGIAPTESQVPQLAHMVNSFEELWQRVQHHIHFSLANIIHQLKTALEP